jgi:glycosyltransferase involved in cell wall biosynthesis
VRVAIDASAAVASAPSGVGKYAAHLIAALAELARSDARLELVCLANRHGIAPEENVSGLTAADIYPHDRLATRLAWMQLGVPRSIRRLRPDVCHFPNHLGPIVRVPQVPFVVTMHDMSVYRCPQYHTRKTVAVHRAIMPALVRRNCWVITVSESARRDLVECLGIPEWRTRVVYSGIAPEFNARAGPNDEAILARHGLRRPYVLSVGTLEPRKNHARLARAFLSLARQQGIPHELVLAGAGGWPGRSGTDPTLAEVLAGDREGRVRVLGYVPSADLPALYRHAAVFAFPSLYEGFGLPVVEALASGTPTLISRDPALMEVASDGAAATVDAVSVDDIASGLMSLIADERLRASARARGLARARRFSWEACARQTLSVYEDAIRPNRGQRLFAAS